MHRDGKMEKGKARRDTAVYATEDKVFSFSEHDSLFRLTNCSVRITPADLSQSTKVISN